MSDQGYTPTEQELVAAWIQAHQVPAGRDGWVDRESEPRGRIAEGHRGIAEVRREAAEAAWDKGCDAFEEAHKQDHLEPWPHLGENPYRKGATA